MATKLYVGNLSFGTTEGDLRTLFQTCGSVTSCSMIIDKFTGKSRGFAFVEMSSSAEAAKAISDLHGKEFDGRPLTVNEAKPRAECYLWSELGTRRRLPFSASARVVPFGAPCFTDSLSLVAPPPRTQKAQATMVDETEMAEARRKMIAKRFGGAASTSTGGKGTIRRKKKAPSRSTAAQSDAKLGTALKKLGATNIPGIEEVNLFKEDGKVIHFVNPKVQASIAANTYIVSGPSETKPLQDLLPSIVSQLGMENLSQLQNIAAAAGGGAGAAAAAAGTEAAADDDDDDVPDLVEGNFEEVSEN